MARPPCVLASVSMVGVSFGPVRSLERGERSRAEAGRGERAAESGARLVPARNVGQDQ